MNTFNVLVRTLHTIPGRDSPTAYSGDSLRAAQGSVSVMMQGLSEKYFGTIGSIFRPRDNLFRAGNLEALGHIPPRWPPSSGQVIFMLLSTQIMNSLSKAQNRSRDCPT